MGVFSAGNYWFWVPIIGPLVGGVIGGVVYDLVIGNALAPRSDS
jgi:glycerol uptake facilitator-like aquaporin